MPGLQLPLTAFILGSIWGMLWMVLSGLLMMMVGGIIFAPPAGLAALLSGVMAVGMLYLAPQTRSLSRQASFAGAMIFVLVLAGRMAPFGLSLSEAIVIQFITLILWACLSVVSVNICLAGFTPHPVSRYLFEILILRVLKGLGLVLLSVFVALPFYVMVMTSLKSQQSLLANPLDFSINIGAPPSELFRSYIELFTDFHFGTFLINSAIVSVVTVLISLAFAIPGAYAVARLSFPGQAFLSRSILLIYMVPAIILVIPLYAVFSQLGLRNSLVGLLTGKYNQKAQPSDGRLSWDNKYAARYGEAWMHQAADKLQEIAEQAGLDPLSLAVAWVARHKAITAPIISARNRDQLAPSLRAADLALEDEVYQALCRLAPTPPPATDRLEEQQS